MALGVDKWQLPRAEQRADANMHKYDLSRIEPLSAAASQGVPSPLAQPDRVATIARHRAHGESR